MGINGLIPFLKQASREANLEEFSGQVAAVDAYSWIHKGAFSCAEKLGKGEKTNVFVAYCMKYVKLLQSYNIKPVLVFDGLPLPAKSETEKKRREKRMMYKSKANFYLKEGKLKDAYECFQRCVEVTPEMAKEVIEECHKINVDCIVAPYEADAQLACLNFLNISHFIISEDSDLLVFGCDKVLFKLDKTGRGLLIEKKKIPEALKGRVRNFSEEKFRYACILSGCDYLPSLHGIGLAKACKFFSQTDIPNVYEALTKLPKYLNMPHLLVSTEYRLKFIQANQTFLHQLVFNPLLKKLQPLTPHPPGTNSNEFLFAGPMISEKKAYHIALGNTNLENYTQWNDFNPEKFMKFKTSSSNLNPFTKIKSESDITKSFKGISALKKFSESQNQMEPQCIVYSRFFGPPTSLNNFETDSLDEPNKWNDLQQFNKKNKSINKSDFLCQNKITSTVTRCRQIHTNNESLLTKQKDLRTMFTFCKRYYVSHH